MLPWQSAEFDQHEQVCTFFDAGSGLKAIVAIHDTGLGPAAGGTRFCTYAEDRLALDDALRLSRAMSFKWALAGLPVGGGKAVLIGDPAILKTERLLHAYGHFLNRIGASFCTGEDVGFSVADCEIIRQVSPYVAGTVSAGAGDPSVHTARGVLYGLRAVLETRFERTDFSGIRCAVQGLGNVGMRVCEHLYEAGAKLTVADIDTERSQRAAKRFNAHVVNPNAIHAAEVDIFVPCALGGVINRHTVTQIHAKAVAGAANNQLESPQIGQALHQRGILFAPDYVINAGGVMGAVEELARIPGRAMPNCAPLETRLRSIQQRLLDIFARAAAEQSTPEAIAAQLGRELLASRSRSP